MCSASLAVLWQQLRPPWTSQCLSPLLRVTSLLACLYRFHAQALLRQRLALPAEPGDALAVVHYTRPAIRQPKAGIDPSYAAKTSCSTPVAPGVLEMHPRKSSRQQYLVMQRQERELAREATLVLRHLHWLRPNCRKRLYVRQNTVSTDTRSDTQL